jgi:hypothetical protein
VSRLPAKRDVGAIISHEERVKGMIFILLNLLRIILNDNLVNRIILNNN